jgi:DNA-binding transcriptional regulator YhcF (GntR family)
MHHRRPRALFGCVPARGATGGMSALPPASSPLWAQLFMLDDNTRLPLQARLRLKVVQVILDGRLAPGAALPSSRDLAQALGLSRNTVTAVYQQLVDEAYLEARPRSGVFVSQDARPAAIGDPAHIVDPFSREGAASGTPPHWGKRVLRSLTDQPTLSKPDRWREVPYPFVYGTHDAQLFPTEDFRECCVRSLARSQLPHWTPDFETDDVPDLVEQIRTRLLPKRGVFARPEEILVTVGRATRLLPHRRGPVRPPHPRRLRGARLPARAQHLLAAHVADHRRAGRRRGAGGRVAARARLRLRHTRRTRARPRTR